MFKTSALYKNIIMQLTGIKNNIEFEALMLVCDEYLNVKQEEDVSSFSEDNDD